MQSTDWIEIIVLSALSLTVAWLAGAFRRKSIAGPRGFITDRASVLDLLIPAFAGFCASIFAETAYVLIAIGRNHPPFTSHQTVCIFAVSAAAGFLVIHLMDLTRRRNYLSPRKLPAGVFFGVVGACAVIPLVLAATILIQEIMRRAGAAAPEEHPLLVVFKEPGILDRLLVILSAVIFAPLFEELTFRAHLQAAIRRATGYPWFAVCVTSALFALVHGIWWTMPPLFLLAIGLGYVYERTRNIWATVIMHSLFNALSLTVEYLSMKHH